MQLLSCVVMLAAVVTLLCVCIFIDSTNADDDPEVPGAVIDEARWKRGHGVWRRSRQREYDGAEGLK